MKSGWFFGTPMWQEYLAEYAKTRPECLKEWKSSPLACDHDFTEYVDEPASAWVREEHCSQVIDLRTHKWSDVRKSYRGLINQAEKKCGISEIHYISTFQELHRQAFGVARNDETFSIQGEWLRSGNAMLVQGGRESWIGAVLWIIYSGCAYFASSPSVENNIQHAIIWRSFRLLKEKGVTLIDMGQIDGMTEKEKSVGFFKSGWGGESRPFTIVRRTQ